MKRQRNLVPEIQVNKQETNQNHKKSTKMIKKDKNLFAQTRKKRKLGLLGYNITTFFFTLHVISGF